MGVDILTIGVFECGSRVVDVAMFTSGRRIDIWVGLYSVEVVCVMGGGIGGLVWCVFAMHVFDPCKTTRTLTLIASGGLIGGRAD